MAVTVYCLIITRRHSGRPVSLHLKVATTASPGTVIRWPRVSPRQPAASGTAWVLEHSASSPLLSIIGPAVTAAGVLPPWPAERAQRMRGSAESRGDYRRDTAVWTGQGADVGAQRSTLPK